jgi:hypothetical protein
MIYIEIKGDLIMSDIITKYKVTVIESERGWGQSYETEYYLTEADAHNRVKSINDKNTATHAPDFYVKAIYDGKIEGVMQLDLNGIPKFRELK